MSITYRNIKGIPLTSDEVDDNFRNLDIRLARLESSQGGTETVCRIEQEFNVLKFFTDRGREVGSATIPPFQINPQGEWRAGTRYVMNDLVANGNGQIWICLNPHTAEDWERDRSKWALFLQFNGA
jgi:hypothetical protein